MAVSDQLTSLAVRAKLLEDRYAALQEKAKSDLEENVEKARESAQAQGDELRRTAERKRDGISAWWNDVQGS